MVITTLETIHRLLKAERAEAKEALNRAADERKKALDEKNEGAKEMLLVENLDDKEFLERLFNAMYDELPMPKKRRKNNDNN